MNYAAEKQAVDITIDLVEVIEHRVETQKITHQGFGIGAANVWARGSFSLRSRLILLEKENHADNEGGDEYDQ